MSTPTKQWFQRQDEKLTISPKIEQSFGSRDELQARGVKLAVVQVPGCGPELALHVDGRIFAVSLTEFKGFGPAPQPAQPPRADRVSAPSLVTAPPEAYQGVKGLSGEVCLTRPGRLYASSYLVSRSGGSGASATYSAKIVVSHLLSGGDAQTVSVGTEQTRQMFGDDEDEGPLIVEHETDNLPAGTYCATVWHARTAGDRTALLVNGELAAQTRYGQEAGVWTVNETLVIAKPKERRLW